MQISDDNTAEQYLAFGKRLFISFNEKNENSYLTKKFIRTIFNKYFTKFTKISSIQPGI